MLTLKPVSFYRIFLGLNLSLLASVPVAAQVAPNVPAQVQNTLSKPQIENLPAEFRPELRDLNNFNNLGIDNQDNRFVNPRNISAPKPTQAEPLLTINVPVRLCLDGAHSAAADQRRIAELQRQAVIKGESVAYGTGSICSK